MEIERKYRKELNSIWHDEADAIKVRGKNYYIRWIKPDVNWRINKIIDNESSKNRSQAIHKVFALGVLNGYFKIKLFYPILWRWFYYVKGYTWDELADVITLIKKNSSRSILAGYGIIGGDDDELEDDGEERSRTIPSRTYVGSIAAFGEKHGWSLIPFLGVRYWGYRKSE